MSINFGIGGTPTLSPVTSGSTTTPASQSDFVSAFVTGSGLDAAGLGSFLGSLPNGMRQDAVAQAVADPRVTLLDGAAVERESGPRIVLAQAGPATAGAWGGALGQGAAVESAPALLARATTLLRAGSLVGLASILTTPPPRAVGLQVAPDMFIVANARPGRHDVYLQGADGNWRFSGISGTGTPEGRLVIDESALRAAYGKPLPETVLAMAGARPADVPRDLQTTRSGIVTGMRTATMDPCRNLDGQRHHMVPASLMDQNQDFLTEIGFRLDQPANLVRLPANATQQTDMQTLCGETRPLHNGPNTSRYDEAVQSQLSRIDRAVSVEGLSASEARSAVGRLMDGIRQEIVSGRYTNVNDRALADAIANLRVL